MTEETPKQQSPSSERSEVVEVPNEDTSKAQPWRDWLPKEQAQPSPEKPWVGWQPDPNNESAKPWVDWIKSAGVAGAGPSGNAGG